CLPSQLAFGSRILADTLVCVTVEARNGGCIQCWMFEIRGFLVPQGRVAESGLRHSTRNRAWGNPPWVRIPPLPSCFASAISKSGSTHAFAKNCLWQSLGALKAVLLSLQKNASCRCFHCLIP